MADNRLLVRPHSSARTGPCKKEKERFRPTEIVEPKASLLGHTRINQKSPLTKNGHIDDDPWDYRERNP